MKSFLISLVFTLLWLPLQAQSVLAVKEDFPTYREIYNIDTETMRKEGSYVRLHRFKTDTLALGAYARDEKIGPWHYYGKEGQLLLTYDYDNGEVVRLESGAIETVSIPVKLGNQFLAVNVDTPPLYLGYQEALDHELDLLLEVPEYCIRRGLSGSSIASFTVSRSGNIKDLTIDKVIHPSMEPAIQKAIHGLSSRWIPARRNGQEVESRVNIIFDIQFFENHAPDYKSPYVEKPGVYVIEKIFIPERNNYEG